MAVTELNRAKFSETPADVDYVVIDGTDGGVAPNVDGRTLLIVTNQDSVDAGTLTIEAQVDDVLVLQFGELMKSNIVVTLDAGETKIVGPFPTRAFNDGNDNIVLERGGDADDEIKVAAVFF